MGALCHRVKSQANLAGDFNINHSPQGLIQRLLRSGHALSSFTFLTLWVRPLMMFRWRIALLGQKLTMALCLKT